MTHPNFPVLEGRKEISTDWSLVMPLPLNARVEHGSQVLWRPGFTAWVTAWGSMVGESPTQRVEALKGHVSPNAFDRHHWSSGGVDFLTYRLAEAAGDNRLPALYAFAVAPVGHLQFAVYFDAPEHLDWAYALVTSAAVIQPA